MTAEQASPDGPAVVVPIILCSTKATSVCLRDRKAPTAGSLDAIGEPVGVVRTEGDCELILLRRPYGWEAITPGIHSCRNDRGAEEEVWYILQVPGCGFAPRDRRQSHWKQMSSRDDTQGEQGRKRVKMQCDASLFAEHTRQCCPCWVRCGVSAPCLYRGGDVVASVTASLGQSLSLSCGVVQVSWCLHGLPHVGRWTHLHMDANTPQYQMDATLWLETGVTVAGACRLGSRSLRLPRMPTYAYLQTPHFSASGTCLSVHRPGETGNPPRSGTKGRLHASTETHRGSKISNAT